MNPDWLLKHFDQISEAPDAVPRLRSFILDLAVRGKLVEQDPNDEPAAELLKRIEEKKAGLVTAGEIRKEKPLPPFDEYGTLFDLPASWKWVPIRKVTVDRGQKIPQEDFSYVDVSAINKERGIIASTQVLTPDVAPSRARKIVRKGDVIYSCVRPYLLNIAVIEEEFKPEPIVSTAFAVLNGLGLVLPRYLWLVLRSPFSVDCVEERMRGQAYPAINDGDFANLPFPLPPLAEQNRIVAKVDELMVLCDELEAAQVKRERRRDRLVAATLHGLNNGDDGLEPAGHPTFEESARFYFNHLPRLTTHPEHIQKLRQTILNLAIRGKLVPQDPRDEPASHLLKRIQRKRELLVKEDKIRKGETLPTLSEAETPFDVPQTWLWVRVPEVADSRLGKMLDKAKNKGTPRRYLRNVNVRWFDFDLSDLLEMRFEDSELEEFSLRNGDVLICEGGEPGRCAVWDERETDIFFQKAIHRVRFFGFIVPTFFIRVLCHDVGSGRLEQFFTGVGIKHFTGKGLSRYTFPLPPFAEQHRIVGKVDQLMALCDGLETRLTTLAATHRQLLEATLIEAIAS